MSLGVEPVFLKYYIQLGQESELYVAYGDTIVFIHRATFGSDENCQTHNSESN